MASSFRTWGAGDPVLLVQGLSQHGARWRPVAEVLAADFTVVAVDNRETGGTGPCPDGFTLADLADDALEVMTGLGFERFFLAGISMGGMISQEVLLRAPQRVRAAVLLATHGGSRDAVYPEPGTVVIGAPRPPDPEERFRMVREMWSRLAGPGFAEAHPELTDEMARHAIDAGISVEGVMRQVQAIATFNPDHVPAGCGVPILVVHGDRDPLVPYPNGVRLAERLGVDLVTLEGAGHALEFERTIEVAALLLEHFRRHAHD